MSTRRVWSRVSVALAALVSFTVAGTVNAQGEASRARAIFPKPVTTTIDAEHFDASEIVVKLHEGTHVRLERDRLVFDPERLTERDRLRMRRNDLTDEQVFADVDRGNEVLFSVAGARLVRLFARDEETLQAEQASLEASAREELADLDLYYMLVLPEPDVATGEAIIDKLNALASVEIAYAEPWPAAPAADIAPPTTIDVSPSQGYLRSASSNGIDADWAARLPGGRGAGIRATDMEGGWVLSHEDLPGVYFAQDGWNEYAYFWPACLTPNPGAAVAAACARLLFDSNHGAAVLGELAAAQNSYGATGIVPDVAVGVSSPLWATPFAPHNTAGAVDNAASHLRAGDVLIIEQHQPAAAIPSGVTCPCNCSQFGFMPAEDVQAIFDAVRRATAKGIVVAEAAGNGSMNLDNPSFGGRFNRGVRDSRAILVGAGFSLAPACFTNFGSRVDVQGWGGGVATLGYGGPPNGPPDPTLRANGTDERQFYTLGFGGTSSATPIVAGAAVAVNGARLADGDPLFDSTNMRQWLRATGTPQVPSAQLIGPLPDLRRALPAVAGVLDEVTPPTTLDARAEGVARGWAFHSEQPSDSIQVHFYVDGPAGGGVFGGAATANTSRPDVNTALGINGDHGFEFPIPDVFRDDAAHTLFAYGIDPTWRNRNRELQQQATFTLPNVKGQQEGLSNGVVTEANGRIYGWAYAAQSPSQSVQLDVYVDGDRTTGVFVGTYPANVARADVNLRYGITGNHGFDFDLSSKVATGVTHDLAIYGKDPRGINDRPIAYSQFTVAAEKSPRWKRWF